eukprot:905182_1
MSVSYPIYEPPGAVTQVHNLPHYDLQLNRVDAKIEIPSDVTGSSDFTNTPFVESITVAAGFLIGTALVYLVAHVVWATCIPVRARRALCCGACVAARSGKDEEEGEGGEERTRKEGGVVFLKKSVQYVIWVLCAAVLAVSIWGFTVPTNVSMAVERTIGTNGHIADLGRNLEATSSSTASSIDTLTPNVAIISIAAAATGDEPLLEETLRATIQLMNAQETLEDQLMGSVIELAQSYSEDVNDTLTESNLYFRSAVLCLLIAGVIAAGLTAVRAKYPRLTSNGIRPRALCILKAVIVALILCIFAVFSAVFLVLFASAEACVDPDPLVVEAIDIGMQMVQPDQSGLAQYYILCDGDPTLVNPAHVFINDSRTSLSGVTDFMENIQTNLSSHGPVNQTVVSAIEEVNADLDMLLSNIDSLERLTACPAINEQYQQILIAFCDDLVVAEARLVIIFGLTSTLLAIALLFGCVSKPRPVSTKHLDGSLEEDKLEIITQRVSESEMPPPVYEPEEQFLSGDTLRKDNFPPPSHSPDRRESQSIAGAVTVLIDEPVSRTFSGSDTNVLPCENSISGTNSFSSPQSKYHLRIPKSACDASISDSSKHHSRVPSASVSQSSSFTGSFSPAPADAPLQPNNLEGFAIKNRFDGLRLSSSASSHPGVGLHSRSTSSDAPQSSESPSTTPDGFHSRSSSSDGITRSPQFKNVIGADTTNFFEGV